MQKLKKKIIQDLSISQVFFQIPAHEIFVPPIDHDEDSDDDSKIERFRKRATTIGNGQIPRLSRPTPKNVEAAVKKVMAKRANMPAQKVPTVIRYHLRNTVSPSKKNKPAKPVQVFFSGTMTGWRSVEMAVFLEKEKGVMTDYYAIVDCFPGRYYFKFCVDGEWMVDDRQPIESNVRKNSFGAGHKVVKANVITVKPEDHEVFDALACDSFAVKPDSTSTNTPGWGQEKPKKLELVVPEKISSPGRSSKTGSTDKSGQCLPPVLPPHLTTIVLNQDIEQKCDPVHLPEIQSHVQVNHLYAQSIRDQMLVLASTLRYRKKYITMVYYKPLDV